MTLRAFRAGAGALDRHYLPRSRIVTIAVMRVSAYSECSHIQRTIRMPQPPTLDARQQKSIATMNVADSIRYLFAEGFSKADICRALGKNYSHVRNVLRRSGPPGERMRKATFTVRAVALEKFEGLVQTIGLRRDHYLGELLEMAISVVAHTPANSASTETFLRDYHRPYPPELLESGELVRFKVDLLDALVQEIDRVCEEKRLPRDFFLEGVLEVAVLALTSAQETIGDPISHCQDIGVRFCADYLMDDQQADKLRQEAEEKSLVVQAVSNIKGLSFDAAQRAYSALPESEQQAIRANPEVRSIVDQIRKASAEPIDLRDMLKEVD